MKRWVLPHLVLIWDDEDRGRPTREIEATDFDERERITLEAIRDGATRVEAGRNPAYTEVEHG